jgi:hypothetical protein
MNQMAREAEVTTIRDRVAREGLRTPTRADPTLNNGSQGGDSSPQMTLPGPPRSAPHFAANLSQTVTLV